MTNHSCRLSWILPLVILGLSHPSLSSANTIRYLSGQGPEDAVMWDFKMQDGFRGANGWTQIAVPSCWEQQGFGPYEYDKDVSKVTGIYKTSFSIPPQWKDKRVLIFFDGVYSQADVKINDHPAGKAHQGGSYPFSYDISDLIQRSTRNHLEVTVKKVCDLKAVDNAERGDYWNFGGIFRPVYLKAVPYQYIDWFGIRAEMNGELTVDVYLKYIKDADSVHVQVETIDGNPIGRSIRESITTGQEQVKLTGALKNIQPWSPEQPTLYRLRIELLKNGQAIQTEYERFGFRTFEARPGKGFFLNGQRIILKGASRHNFHPDTARTVSKSDSIKDVRIMKHFLNMNFVRCVNFPPDKHFLDACDEIGLLANVEITGWFKKLPTVPGKDLVKATVSSHMNHPSVIMWYNGNHKAYNPDLHDEFHRWDTQKRPICWNDQKASPKIPGIEKMGDHAIDTRYYPFYDMLLDRLHKPTHLVFPNEVLHALYDGGGGAGLTDYYQAIQKSPVGGGLVIWSYQDEAVVRTDQSGKLDKENNRAPDGIVGPYREYEGAARTVREIFSPVQFLTNQIAHDFDGRITVKNNHTFLSLQSVKFVCSFLKFPGPTDNETDPTIRDRKEIQGPDISPGKTGTIQLELPTDWQQSDALRIQVLDRNNHERIAKTWPIGNRKRTLNMLFQQTNQDVTQDLHTVISGPVKVTFDSQNGTLASVAIKDKVIPLKGGPILLWCDDNNYSFDLNQEKEMAKEAALEDPRKLWKYASGLKLDKWKNKTIDFSHWTTQFSMQEGKAVITSKSQKDDGAFQWTVLPGGILQLDYQFELPEDEYGYVGIGFDLEETSIRSKKWVGAGPTRVWKNRLHGPEFGLWHNTYNNGIPGEVWTLPAFKGCFKDVQWASIETNRGTVIIGLPTENTYLGIGRPANGTEPKNAIWTYPQEGGLFVFHAISPVGAKWSDTRRLGPASQLNQFDGHIKGQLYLKFTQQDPI